MATTVKGGSFGKEKRGTSPSSSSSMIKKSPLSTTQTSSSCSPSEEKTSSPTDGKPPPNYLKPTISSGLDFSRLSKRPNTDSSSAQKPVLNRRRSFDRPPPPAQVHKAIRGVPGARDVKPFRSSSFSNKTTISQSRPASSERPSVRKDVKAEPHLSKSRSLKKSTLSNPSTTTMVNKDSSNVVTSSSTTKKGPKSVTSESSIDHLVIEDGLVNIDHETQSLPEISEMPASNKELGDPDIKLPPLEDDHHKDVVLVEDDQTAPADEPAPAPQENEAPDDHHHEYQTDEKQPDDQERVEEEPAKDDEIEVESSEEQNQTEEGAGEQDEADPTETLPEEDESSEKEDDEKETETKAKDEKQDQLITVKAQPAGKKDNQAYNDVIEETATKLMSKKNKVLALAGAFETVISLQDTNKN